MREKTNLQSFFVAMILLLAGTLSPSNGLDEKVSKTPLEMILTVIVIVSTGLLVYILWDWIENQKGSLKISSKSNEKNTSTSTKLKTR
jgi:hypothetical protein